MSDPQSRRAEGDLDVCQRFEAAWKAGRQPRIEDYLGDEPGANQVNLLTRLIQVEVVYQRRAGREPEPAQYLKRFPALDRVWLRGLMVPSEAPASAPPAAEPEADSRTLDLGPGSTHQPRRSPAKPLHATISASGRPAVDMNPPPAMPTQVGRYQVRRLLGTGGFGAVYLAHDLDLDRPVALKLPHAEQGAGGGGLETVLHEARSVARLNHPGIVRVYDVGRSDGVGYIVSEYIEGPTLADHLERGRTPPLEAAALVAQVADALHYAHLQGWVHRDVKPSNILLDAQGRCHLTDFGLAVGENDPAARQGHVLGTPAYMSPEQARGEGHRVDARTDIYSLGSVLYELLCGRVPFGSEDEDQVLSELMHREPRPPRTIDDTIPRELERICLKALSKRVTDRHTTALDLAEELRSAVASLQARLTPTAPAGALPASALPASGDRLPALEVRVVPKGLRSFDAADAELFLQLVPGPRDREGLPDSIAFWKRRAEGLRRDDTFPVGLIYGPSGCGKSSLVKAGLLPRLARHVVPVYLEATRDDTEARLLAALQHNCSALENCTDLREAFRRLRLGQVLPAGTKLFVVLDQFEQWLHGHDRALTGEAGENALVAALRQADGVHVQCLLMVRDDFWLGISRLFQTLEIPLIEGQNSRLVDLFDPRHARRVLELFGQAYECLPARLADLSEEQQAFLDEAVRGLCEGGKVISVRLSLFADMMKGRPWTRASLAEVGGIAGLGVTFLEETFSSRTAPPSHRLHQEAARAVLRHLLPEKDTQIRGKIRTARELLHVSGYAQRPRDFEQLFGILDAELRIITPTEAASATGSSPAPAEPAAGGAAAYQLTHDYLVPSLREWLNLKQGETRRGRAELLLKERTAQWGLSRHNRLLPTPLESLRIALLTGRSGWSADSRAMMRRAFWVHTRRLGAVAGLVAGLVVAIALVVMKMPKPLETFLNVQAPAERRLKAFATLPLQDEVVFRQALTAVEAERDPVVAGPVLDALADNVEKRDHDSGPQQALFVGVLQNLVRDPSLDPDIPLAAFAALNRVARPVEVVARMPSYFRDDAPEALRRRQLEYVKAQAAALSHGEVPAGAAKPLREAVIKLTAGLVEHKGLADRSEAFRIYASVAPASQVLNTVGVQCTPTADRALTDAMLAYVRDLDPAGLPEASRGAVLRQLVALLRKHEHKELVAHCLEQLDKLTPATLCDWLLKAFQDVDVKEVARESLVPYLRKAHDRERVALVAEYVQKRVVALVPVEAAEDEIRTPPELEFFLQALGQLAAQTGVKYPAARQVVATLLDRRDRLDDPAILDTAVEAFAELYDGDQAQLAPVRAMVDQVGLKQEVRVAAVNALAKVQDLPSLARLKAAAVNAKKEKGVLNLQVAAVRGAGELGVRFRSQPGVRQGVLEMLRLLITRHKQEARPREVMWAVLEAFGRLADAKEATVLLDFLGIPEFNTRAVSAIHAILLRTPPAAGQLVEGYLEWRARAGANAAAGLWAPPDEALVGFAGVYGPAEVSGAVKEEAAKAIVPALAAALLNGDPAVRKLAVQFLAGLLQAADAPRLDPMAAESVRQDQVARWQRWWREAAGRQRLKGAGLTSER